MRKHMMTLAAVAVLAITLTACGTAQTSNNPTPTVEPTKEVEATTTPTAEPTTTSTPVPTATPEPTATSTPVPTATPEPTATSTPVPTATPEPTATSTPTPEPTATSTPTPEPTPTEAPVIEDEGMLWAVVEELLPLEASERTAYLESKYGTRYVITVENNLDKLLPESLTAEQKELAHESFINAMDWCFGPNMSGARPTGEYYLTLLTDTVTGQAHALWFSIYQNLYDAYGFEVTSTILKECNPRDFYEIFYYNVEEYGLEFDINGDGVIGYNEALYVSETEEPTVEPTETPAEPTSDADDASNFAMLKDMIFTVSGIDDTYSYAKIASIIETMDESRYVVTAVEGLSPILKESLTDAQKQSVLDALFADNDDFWGEYPVEEVDKWGRTCEVRYPATPTGEFYTMTLTDIATSETFAWGFRVTVEANDEPETYYVLEDSIVSILCSAQRHWSWGHTNYTNCAKDYTDVFDEKYDVLD